MRFKVKYSYDGSVGPKHPDALHKPNANKVKKMKNIELEPRCMIKDNKNFSKYSSKMDFAVTNRGHLVPCCFIDQPEELDDPIMKKMLKVSKISEHDSVKDIIYSDEWKEFATNLAENNIDKVMPVCVLHCSKERYKGKNRHSTEEFYDYSKN